MRTLILTILVGTLLVGCGKTRPTYQLTVGTKTIKLVVHDDPKRIQDDLVSNIKPLWDELEPGASPTFHYKRISPLYLGKEVEETVRKKYGDSVEFTSTQTSTSFVWRFFKNKDGSGGAEHMQDGKWLQHTTWASDTDSNQVEKYIRKSVLDIKSIRMGIQNDWSD